MSERTKWQWKLQWKMIMLFFAACFCGSLCYALQEQTPPQQQAPPRPSSLEIDKLRQEILVLQSDLFVVGEKFKEFQRIVKMRIEEFQRIEQQLRQTHVSKTKELSDLEATWLKAQEKKTTGTLEIEK